MKRRLVRVRDPHRRKTKRTPDPAPTRARTSARRGIGGRTTIPAGLHTRLRVLVITLRYTSKCTRAGNLKGLLALMFNGAMGHIERELEHADTTPSGSPLLCPGYPPNTDVPADEPSVFHYTLPVELAAQLDAWLARTHGKVKRSHVVAQALRELIPVVESLDPANLTDDALIQACRAHCDGLTDATP